MNIHIAFVTDLEPSKRVKPRNRTLDWPTRFAEATAMRRADFFEHWRDASLVQAPPKGFGTVAPVALNDLRLVQRTAGLAPDVWNGIDQRIKLGKPCRLAALRMTASGMPCASTMGCCLLPSLRRSVGFGPVFSRQHGANRGAVDERTREIDFATATQFGEQRFVDALPDSRFLPCHGGVAGKLRPNRIPFPAAGGPTQCPSAARTLCPLARLRRVSVCGPHTGDCEVLVLAAVVR